MLMMSGTADKTFLPHKQTNIKSFKLFTLFYADCAGLNF